MPSHFEVRERFANRYRRDRRLRSSSSFGARARPRKKNEPARPVSAASLREDFGGEQGRRPPELSLVFPVLGPEGLLGGLGLHGGFLHGLFTSRRVISVDLRDRLSGPVVVRLLCGQLEVVFRRLGLLDLIHAGDDRTSYLG